MVQGHLGSTQTGHFVGIVVQYLHTATFDNPQKMATEDDLRTFIDRQRTLLAKERDAEIERSSLLLSNCGSKLLEQKGLSVGGLGVVSMNIGLGGKT